MEISIADLKLQLKDLNKQLDKLMLLGSNNEKIVDKKRFLQKQIKNYKSIKNEK